MSDGTRAGGRSLSGASVIALAAAVSLAVAPLMNGNPDGALAFTVAAVTLVLVVAGERLLCRSVGGGDGE